MTKYITFTNMLGVSDQYKPTPASVSIPDWYKNMDSYQDGKKEPDSKGETKGTAKKCMPIFDAITNGYIIYTYCDIFVSQRLEYGKSTGKKHPTFTWPSFEPIKQHPKWQLPIHPQGDGHDLHYPKWHNAWAIKTEPGYSCLFVPPLHRDNPMIMFPGVVDTDIYTDTVNFPFVLKNPEMEGLIPAGTPIAQVIPFKREEWQMKFGNDKDVEDNKNINKKLRVFFFDSYKKQFRQSKEYR